MVLASSMVIRVQQVVLFQVVTQLSEQCLFYHPGENRQERDRAVGGAGQLGFLLGFQQGYNFCMLETTREGIGTHTDICYMGETWCYLRGH